jgi:hypothetical protein
MDALDPLGSFIVSMRLDRRLELVPSVNTRLPYNKALSNVDFPTFDLPASAISGAAGVPSRRLGLGNWSVSKELTDPMIVTG